MWDKVIEFVDDALSVREILEVLRCSLSQGELEELADELVHCVRFDECEYLHEE